MYLLLIISICLSTVAADWLSTAASNSNIQCYTDNYDSGKECVLRCMVNAKSSSVVITVGNNDYCKRPDSKNKPSNFSFSFDIRDGYVKALFTDSYIPPKFWLYKVIQALELKGINHLKFQGDKKSLFNPPKSFLSNIKDLDQLDILNVNLKFIPNYFLNVKDLTVLKISNTTLKVVRYNEFVHLDNLKQLFLNNNEIAVVEPGSFENLKNLQVLDLSFNKLTTLPYAIFQNLPSLTSINLDSNSLNKLPTYLFYINNNQNLSHIRMQNNQLTYLPNGLFEDLKSLTTVKLSYNELVILPSDLFQGTSSLELIALDHNHLERLPVDLFKDTALKYLYLASNNLTEFNANVMMGLEVLESLDLSENYLQNVYTNICKYMPNIRKIYFSNNKLKSLNARSTSIKNQPDSIKENSVFARCQFLEQLHLEGNEISALSYDLVYSETLKNVFLSNNSITNLTFDATKSNHNIYLDNNKITNVDLNLWTFEQLASKNELTNHLMLSLRGNPWNCGCDNLDFHHFIQGKMNPNVYKNLKIVTSGEFCFPLFR